MTRPTDRGPRTDQRKPVQADVSRYITLKVSPENQPELSAALAIASDLNDWDASETKTPEARQAEAFRRILIDWLIEHRPVYWALANDRARAGRFKIQGALALERDEYRCVRCKHTRIGSGGLQVAEVVTSSMLDPHVPSARVREIGHWDGMHNLFSVCRPCLEDLNGKGLNYRCAVVPKILAKIAAPAEWIAEVLPVLIHRASHGEQNAKATGT